MTFTIQMGDKELQIEADTAKEAIVIAMKLAGFPDVVLVPTNEARDVIN